MCLLLILSGSLSVLQQHTSFPGNKLTNEVHSHNAYAGELLGGLAVLTGETSQYTVRARHHSKVAIISRTVVYK